MGFSTDHCYCAIQRANLDDSEKSEKTVNYYGLKYYKAIYIKRDEVLAIATKNKAELQVMVVKSSAHKLLVSRKQLADS